MKDYELEEILWRAIEAPVGIELATNDVDCLKRRLYSTRAKAREAGNTAFDSLAFVTPISNPDTTLWLVKQS